MVVREQPAASDGRAKERHTMCAGFGRGENRSLQMQTEDVGARRSAAGGRCEVGKAAGVHFWVRGDNGGTKGGHTVAWK